MMLRSQRVTSQLFKTLTGWQPRFPSAWEGWRFVVAELGSSVPCHDRLAPLRCEASR